MNNLDSLAIQFIAETRDNLDDAARCLLELEKNADPNLINGIFRNFHNIKGTSSIFPEFAAITSLTHVAEDLMALVRKGRMNLACEHVDLFLNTLDLVGTWLDVFEATREIPSDASQASAPIREKFLSLLRCQDLEQPPPQILDFPTALELPLLSTAVPLPERLQQVQVSPQDDTQHRKTDTLTYFKINQTLISRYVDGIDDMTGAVNMLSRVSERATTCYQAPFLSEEIDSAIFVFKRMIENFQEIAQEMRLLSFATVFERYPRLVRDLSIKLGKKINLVLEGEDTMADRDVIDALAGPLVHLVRNSMDHGLETPEERLAAGKPPEGTLRLSAWRNDSEVVVEIHDDGRGIDPEQIRKKAAEKGIAAPEILAAMTDESLIQLILEPNFSTAESVTDLSGRGVGMDVVNSVVQNFGGSVNIFSVKGYGSRIKLTLPLSVQCQTPYHQAEKLHILYQGAEPCHQ